MVQSKPGVSGGADARHSEAWYAEALDETPPRSGDRMFIRCEGGPCLSRLETFPPRMEIREKGGLYVLEDLGPLAEWAYQFVPVVDH
jgi:hypothetical protein